MIVYRQRFSLTGHPLPKNAQGKTFFDKSPGYLRLKRRFQDLIDDPGIGLLTGDAGVGTTAAMRNLCNQLPKPDYLVLYLCDTTVSPLDLYRTLALELGIRPAHRRAQLWTDIKRTMCHMVDERGVHPLLIIDRAHLLSDRFFADLGGLTSFAFDSRQIMTLWLVGQPELGRRLSMQVHASLKMLVSAEVHLEPLDREAFALFLDHGLRAAGATQNLLSDPARELLFRSCRGVPRVASKLLRSALQRAHERDQNFIDDHILEAVLDEAAPQKGAA
jgi:type II secretory pathway predicted ATPase ExeA